ncbi:MAG: hypothetical protein QXL71_09110 [Candidatus Bathyarchaeia archaeon]
MTKKPENQNPQDDSFTEVHILKSGKRVPTGIRVDSGLWEAFKKTLSANGLSTCEILENVILGLTVGLTTKVHSSKTINVYCEVPKFVRRVRRARVEYVDEGVEGGKRRVRFYDLSAGGLWRWVEVENDWDVNVNGHYVGCECSVCSRIKVSKHE